MGMRETLRVTEEQVLLNAATAYMDTLQNGAIVDIYRTMSKYSPSF